MKKVRILLAVLLSIVLFTTLFTACSQKSGQTSGAATAAGKASDTGPETTKAKDADALKDKLEISIAMWDIDSQLANASQDQFIQKLYKDLNITIKPINITWDDYTQKIQMWAASDQLPDVFSIDAVGTQYYRNWINQGVVKALPDDLSKYPTLQNYLNNPDFQAMKENGKLFCVPRGLYDSLDYCAHDRVVFYRWDLAQKAGITKEPETWDEFKATLKAIVQKDPEGKKIGGLTAVNVKQIDGFFYMFSNPAANSDGSGSDFKWIKEDGKYIPAIFSKNSLPSLQNARDMYEQGLIDKDIALVKGQEGYDKFASGKAAALLQVNYLNFNNKVLGRWKKLYPDTPIFDAVRQMKYFPSTDGNRYHPVFRTFWSESYFSSKVDDKKMDRIMRLYDYLLQPDIKEAYRFGVKGADYTKEGDKIKLITPIDELRKKQPCMDEFINLAEYDNQFQYNPNNFTMDPDVLNAAITDMEYVKKNTKIPDYEPRLTYVSTPVKDKFTVFPADFILKIMTGNEPVDKMWNDVVKEHEAKGLSKMIEEGNARAKELGIN